MDNIFSRTISLIEQSGFEALKKSHIILCGCGGVGSYTLEALVRSGVGEITVIDNDTVSLSNINRQIIATHSSIGQYKVDVAQKRALDINPDIIFHSKQVFITPQNIECVLDKNVTYIIDAIDHVPAKVAIAQFSKNNNIPLLSCLGTGNRLDATKFEIKDIYNTSGCPLARKMRYELKKADIKKLDVLVSDAPTVKNHIEFDDGKRCVGSIAYVPSVAGLLAAQHVINKILEKQKNENEKKEKC